MSAEPFSLKELARKRQELARIRLKPLPAVMHAHLQRSEDQTLHVRVSRPEHLHLERLDGTFAKAVEAGVDQVAQGYVDPHIGFLQELVSCLSCR